MWGCDWGSTVVVVDVDVDLDMVEVVVEDKSLRVPWSTGDRLYTRSGRAYEKP